MLISEKGLVRAIKRAYKNSGYVVMNTGDAVAIYTENWFVLANRAWVEKSLAEKGYEIIDDVYHA